MTRATPWCTSRLLHTLLSRGLPINPKLKKIWIVGLDSLTKGFDAMNATQKRIALCKVPFLKKSRKYVQNGHFFLAILDQFSRFFLFHKQYLAESWGFFLHCIQFMFMFELSKSTIRQISRFFTIRQSSTALCLPNFLVPRIYGSSLEVTVCGNNVTLTVDPILCWRFVALLCFFW